MIDIYFDPNYGKLYEKMENGTCEVFEHRSSLGHVHHMFIKREIPIKVDGKTYYDLITPYGYGGPLITTCQNGEETELVNEFEIAFRGYCERNDIVSEFVRFHPVVGNAIDFQGCYAIQHLRNTVGTSLEETDDPFQSAFSKSCRKRVRKGLRDGVSYKITEKPTDLEAFKKIYHSTMDRNNASDFYYFDDKYFEHCIKLLGENLLLVEALYKQQPIAMGFYFVYNKMIHIHLSGTLSEYLYLSPAYILRYAVTTWGKEKGYELIHHGGGRTNDPNDGLYLFKKQFGNTEFEFCIGKKVWNEGVYQQLCRASGVNQSTEFFPAYRHN